MSGHWIRTPHLGSGVFFPYDKLAPPQNFCVFLVRRLAVWSYCTDHFHHSRRETQPQVVCENPWIKSVYQGRGFCCPCENGFRGILDHFLWSCLEHSYYLKANLLWALSLNVSFSGLMFWYIFMLPTSNMIYIILGYFYIIIIKNNTF